MPQMEFADYAPQLVWLVITFVALYFLMAQLALPRVEAILTNRDNRIQSDLERAADMGREAEAAQRAYDRVVSETRAHAQRVAAEARAKAQAEQAARIAKLDGQLTDQTKKAEAGIAAERNRAMESLRDVAAEVAQVAVERITGSKVSRETAVNAVEVEMKARG